MNDLGLIKLLVDYNKENPALSKVAGNKFAKHLWYLSEELVGLAFFDPAVSVTSKREMVKSISERVGMDDPLKRAAVDMRKCDSMVIEDFVTQNTKRFFKHLHIETGFLEEDPTSWELREDYLAGLKTVQQLRVVNDNAERAVALIEEYNSIITRKENQKQYLLQVVQDHRWRFPDCKKGLLAVSADKI